jgi:hypothetical protein
VLFGLGKKYKVPFSSPHSVATQIAALWERIGLVLTLVRDNGFIEIDLKLTEIDQRPVSGSSMMDAPANTTTSHGAPKFVLQLVLQRAAFRRDEYELFVRYQKSIHDDPSTPDGYTRFLCDSGLSADAAEDAAMIWQVSVPNDNVSEMALTMVSRLPESSNEEHFIGTGTFHLRYEVRFIDVDWHLTLRFTTRIGCVKQPIALTPFSTIRTSN